MAEKAVKPTEEKLKPKLFSVMKNYSKEQLIKDAANAAKNNNRFISSVFCLLP